METDGLQRYHLASGLAQLGYGDGDEQTTLSYGGNATNRHITYYFRRAFTVTDTASIGALTVRFVRDDGCVIYLNGVEIVRSNMPGGTVTAATLATTAIGNADESAWNEAPVDSSLLATGTNLIAVEIHQQSVASSDISFDLELRAAEAQSPVPSVTLRGDVANSGVTHRLEDCSGNRPYHILQPGFSEGSLLGCN